MSALTAKALDEYLKRMHKQAEGNRLLDLIGPGLVTADALKELERGRG